MRGAVDVVVVGMEPTGPYWKPLFAQLKGRGYPLVLVHSKAVKHNRKTMAGNDGKTDSLDTLCIWDLLRQGKSFVPVEREAKLEAAYRMMHHYEDSCKRSGQIRNQLRAVLAVAFPELNERFKKLDSNTALAFLAKNPTPDSIRCLGPKRFLERWRGRHGCWGRAFFAELYELAKHSIGVQDVERSYELEIRSLAEEHSQALQTQQQWFERARALVEDHDHFALLLSIKGIGEKIATGLLASLGDPARFENGKQWVSLAGLDLKLHESGESIRKTPKISRQGKGLLRYWLFLAAEISVRYPGPFRDLYLRRQKNSPGRGARKRALIAVCDKLVRVIFAMLRDGKPYDPNQDQQLKRRYSQLKNAA
jgi:transposase